MDDPTPSLPLSTADDGPAGPDRLAPDPTAPERRDRRRARRQAPWLWVGGLMTFVVVAGMISSAFVRVPYYAFQPGSVRTVDQLIEVDGAPTYDGDGQVNFLTVSIREATALEAALGWLDPDTDLIPREEVLGDRDPEENRQLNVEAMRDSKQVAVAVALDALGYEVTISGTGAMIVEVVPDTPAAEVLEPGDTVVAVDGRPVELASELVEAIGAADPGDELTLTVEPMPPHPTDGDPTAEGPDADDEGAEPATETVTVTLGAHPDEPGRPFLGVSSATRDERYEFPFDVRIDSGDVGGPSAGLAFSLGVADALTPGDLTGGLKIATTGTMAPDGTVGPVGGVPQKMAAARADGVDLLLVPTDEYELALLHAGGVRVEPVATFGEALEVLARVGGEEPRRSPAGEQAAGG